MVTSTFGHMQVNIRIEHRDFYKKLFGFLGWKVLLDIPDLLGIEDENHVSLWFCKPIKALENDYDGVGMNHLGISVPSQAAVDETVVYLHQNGIVPLFDTPRHRPDFCENTEDTYYQVMFESPDRILFEVVYTGPKAD